MGVLLITYSVSHGNIIRIDLTVDGTTINFLDKIKSKSKLFSSKHRDKLESFDSRFKFYYVNINNKQFILAVCYLSDNVIRKISFNLNGVVLSNITDTLVCNNIIHRNDNKNTFHILNDNV